MDNQKECINEGLLDLPIPRNLKNFGQQQIMSIHNDGVEVLCHWSLTEKT